MSVGVSEFSSADFDEKASAISAKMPNEDPFKKLADRRSSRMSNGSHDQNRKKTRNKNDNYPNPSNGVPSCQLQTTGKSVDSLKQEKHYATFDNFTSILFKISQGDNLVLNFKHK